MRIAAALLLCLLACAWADAGPALNPRGCKAIKYNYRNKPDLAEKLYWGCMGRAFDYRRAFNKSAEESERDRETFNNTITPEHWTDSPHESGSTETEEP